MRFDVSGIDSPGWPKSRRMNASFNGSSLGIRSGVLDFQGGVSGVFLRADDCQMLSGLLRQASDALLESKPVSSEALRELSARLKEVGGADEGVS